MYVYIYINMHMDMDDSTTMFFVLMYMSCFMMYYLYGFSLEIWRQRKAGRSCKGVMASIYVRAGWHRMWRSKYPLKMVQDSKKQLYIYICMYTFIYIYTCR